MALEALQRERERIDIHAFMAPIITNIPIPGGWKAGGTGSIGAGGGGAGGPPIIIMGAGGTGPSTINDIIAYYYVGT